MADAFPASVVEVPTAVPAFVGFTERDRDGERSLTFRPRRIGSLREFEELFGGAPPLRAAFTLTDRPPAPPDDARTLAVPAGPREPVAHADGVAWYLARRPTHPRSFLYYGLKSFYENGGGPCVVVSIGSYGDAADAGPEAFLTALDVLLAEAEPTLLVLPDAVLLPGAACRTVQETAVAHCARTGSRFAILDVFRGWLPRDGAWDGQPGGGPDGARGRDCIADFREIAAERPGWAAAYYPWLDTTVVVEGELGYGVFDAVGRGALQALLTAELVGPLGEGDPTRSRFEALIAEVGGSAAPNEATNGALRGLSPTFDALLERVQAELCRIPPSATMAGVYTLVDNTRGVWKAPANVSLAGVVKPAVDVAPEEQEDLNVPAGGRAVNAIRAFVGEGTLVWGARTLDGDSLDWRYVQVRRTMIMLEQSIRLACRTYVFEPNDASTWVTIKGMVGNFLTGIWKRGGLAGSSPDEAFSVHVGLGETMTARDVLDGILRVTVLVAPTRPAEFVEITFQQAMQKA